MFLHTCRWVLYILEIKINTQRRKQHSSLWISGNAKKQWVWLNLWIGSLSHCFFSFLKIFEINFMHYGDSVILRNEDGWMCSCNVMDNRENMEVMEWLGLDQVSLSVQRIRLQWFGRVDHNNVLNVTVMQAGPCDVWRWRLRGPDRGDICGRLGGIVSKGMWTVLVCLVSILKMGIIGDRRNWLLLFYLITSH